MDEALSFRSAIELAALIRSKELSPVDLVAASLEQLERTQPRVNAFVSVCADRAMEDAREAERKLMTGEPLGPLHGVPFSVKDMLDVDGLPTTYGAAHFPGAAARAEAVAITRMKRSGAILVGKTTTPPFASGALTESPLFGRTLNVWDPERTAGGSSGGSAASVAAGVTPISIATDSGGSTRIPAACNGVVGMKQTLGMVPDSSMPDAFGSLIYINPITRTVRDAALSLQVMSGPDPRDPLSLHRPPAELLPSLARDDLLGLRIGWQARFGNTLVQREVIAACEAALRTLGTLGACVSEVNHAVPSFAPWYVLQNAYRLARYRKLFEDYPGVAGREFLRSMEVASEITGLQLSEAQFARTDIAREVQTWFADVDILATPTLSATAIRKDHRLDQPLVIEGQVAGPLREAWYPYTPLFNLSGNPAITIPCGWDDAGLPVGLQLVGPWGSDALLLSVAALLETAMPWAHRRPRLQEEQQA